MLGRRSAEIYCVQETRFRGNSVRMINGKAAKYKLFWIGNENDLEGVGIFFVTKWIDKVIDIIQVNDRIVIKILVQGSIISVIPVYAPQCVLDDSQKNDFYDSLINVVRKLGEKKILVTEGDLNGHFGSNPENWENQHGHYAYGFRNKDREKILEFCTAKNKTVGNTLFK